LAPKANSIATNGSTTNGTATNHIASNGIVINGTTTNGTSTNGTNGTTTNGHTTNGSDTNDTSTNGTSTNGITTNGNSSHTNGNGIHKPTSTSPTPKLLIWSSADQEGINRLLQSHTSYFNSHNIPTKDSETYLEQLAYTLQHHRSSLLWKSHTIVKSLADLQDLEKLTAPAIKQLSDPSVAFVFTGQGAQWARMGIELLAFPTFRTSLEEAEAYMRGLGSEWSLIEELEKAGPESRINRAALSQPLCTALQVAVVDLLTEVGVRPVAVVGHSSGEIAAGYVLPPTFMILH
jgi:acyl transferase domain-containing protein